MRNRISLRTVLSVIALAAAAEVSAQWQVGIEAGMDITSIDRSQAGRVDETYSSEVGWTCGLMARYSVRDWLAVRTGFDVMDRTHRMDRNITYLDPVYTEYKNTYLTVPLMADFSFGGTRLRGHMYAGGFAGYWLNAEREGTTYWMTDYYVYFSPFDERVEFTDEQQRFTAGLQTGAGISYLISNHLGVSLDAIYYYDLVSYQKSSEHLSDPRYLSSLAVSLGVTWNF